MFSSTILTRQRILATCKVKRTHQATQAGGGGGLPPCGRTLTHSRWYSWTCFSLRHKRGLRTKLLPAVSAALTGVPVSWPNLVCYNPPPPLPHPSLSMFKNTEGCVHLHEFGLLNGITGDVRRTVDSLDNANFKTNFYQAFL